MGSTRGTGQKLIPVPANEQFIRQLTRGVRAAGYSNRSQFIREAIVEKLSRLGIVIHHQRAPAPARPVKPARRKTPARRTQ
jgi:Arc/MetJ-type ribon-helix-helix transcriptional regulator